MGNKAYLDFDEAVIFLKTTPSTMYKWLQVGKVPGHKLGRQWRFLKTELELHISGKGPELQMQKEILELESLFLKRAPAEAPTQPSAGKDQNIDKKNQRVAEQMIWDAYDHGTRLIHIGPAQGKYGVRYRQRKGFENLTVIQEETFKALDQGWRHLSSPMRDDDMRRLYLNRDQGDALQVRYQKIETVAGPRITLELWNPQQDVLSLEKISEGNSETLGIFRSWAKKSSGLIVICGVSGSGKTTTVHSLLREIQNQGAAVFTVENPVEIVIEGIDQIELAKKTEEEFDQAYERIMYSDPDAVAFGLGHFQGLEKIMVEKAVAAASTGHLVILQWQASSCEDALEQIGKYTGQNIETVLIGACHQKLIPSEKKLKAVYQFQVKK